MDNRSFQFSVDFTTKAKATATATRSNTTHNMDHYLRQLNMLSHNITKPISKHCTFNYKPYLTHPRLQPPPPFYSVTKNDFKDVVQQLTGSSSHQPIISTPPPIQKPKSPTSRLERFRPPPLEEISNRTPLLLNDASAVPSNDVVVAPLCSPQLAPLPSVRVDAESPITAYMRFLNNSVAPSVDPLWSPSILFSPSADQLGFPHLVPSPGAESKHL